MAIRKFKPESPDKALGKIKGDTELARLAHLNRLVDDINNTNIVGPAGPQGVQGPIGPQGVPGPVGPAGLNWQGSWVSGNSYVADDAVGYGGASWFCILATSGTTTPDLDTTHWALLASQGAQGPAGATGAQGPTGPQGIQGIQGPIGPTGPQGPAGTSAFDYEYLGVTGTNGATATPITKVYTDVYLDLGNYVKLPSSPSIGDIYYIANTDPALNLIVYGGSNTINLAGTTLNSNYYTAGTLPNKVYVFQYASTGKWQTWTLSSAKPSYKVYSAFLNGTTPTATVLENTLGVTLNWSNPANGVFRATAASGTPFTANKTVVVPGTVNNAGSPYFVTGKPWVVSPTSVLNIDLQLHDGTQSSTPNVSNMFIEIRVYN